MSDFKGDLSLGEIGVQLTRKIFKNRGFLSRLGPKGNFPGYDLQVKRADSPEIREIEVKFDLSSALTGNLALEHHALEKSQASHYVYLVVVPLIISKEKLLWVASNPDFPQVRGGDFNETLSLVPLEALPKAGFKKL